MAVTLLPVRAVSFVLVVLFFSAVTALLRCGSPLPRRAAVVTVYRWIGRACARIALLCFGFNWISEHGTRDSRARTIVANHLSLMDILAVMAIEFPSFVAKAYVEEVPFVGSIAATMRCVFVQTHGTSGVIVARQLQLDREPDRERLLVFPEGTTTNGLTIGALQAALATRCMLSYVLCVCLTRALNAISAFQDRGVSWRSCCATPRTENACEALLSVMGDHSEGRLLLSSHDTVAQLCVIDLAPCCGAPRW